MNRPYVMDPIRASPPAHTRPAKRRRRTGNQMPRTKPAIKRAEGVRGAWVLERPVAMRMPIATLMS